jgi:hypothetical protein
MNSRRASSYKEINERLYLRKFQVLWSDKQRISYESRVLA